MTSPSPRLDWTFKALPASDDSVAIADIAGRRWNILAEDVMLPAAVLHESALDHNLQWMRRFCEAAGVEICPHGKTSMAPELFQRQLSAGAWGITAATVPQLRVYRKHGIKRIIFANQLVGRQNIAYVINELERDPGLDLYCLVDSHRGIDLLDSAVAASGLKRPLQLLVELGLKSGRGGVRHNAEAVHLAERIAKTPRLSLRGIEAFEGIVAGHEGASADSQVSGFVERICDVAEQCEAKGLFSGKPLLTAGGSAFFDIVAGVLARQNLKQRFTIVLRSGCYITHDSGHYELLVDRLISRSGIAAELGRGLRPALELWAYVLSRPEPGRIIAGLGKRDASFDIALPKPLRWSQAGSGEQRPVSIHHRTVRLDDQHAYLDVPADSPLQVGDLLGFGISHPCTTFDRWPALYVVDDDLNVTGAMRTFF